MKTVLFIPGFGEGLESRDYRSVLQAFESKNYQAVFVPIKWERTDLGHWLKEFNKTYREYDPSQTILAGFSFGAVTAFAAAAERQPAELWLCSLSPYFDSDNPKKSWLTFIGKRRAQAFAALDFPALTGKISCPTKVMYGALEVEEVKHRARKAHALIKNSQLIEVPGAKHDIAASAYIEAIKKTP